jgi:cytochrome c oxidase assembly protein subunit 15
MSAEDWESVFEKYRASPEFKLLNPHMTLSEFKKIYFMEWTHRIWGRVIGMSFVLPTLYFIARKRVTPKMAVNLLGISCMIGFQGFIGWWMVKSGLKDDLFAPGSHPRVSQYRLTAHLCAAFVCYSWMFLSALSIFRSHRFLANPQASLDAIKAMKNPALSIFRRSVFGVAALVFMTAMSGGLVAGLDAGLIYNEFPKMGLGLTPPASELWDKFYSRKEDGSDLWWRNMLENPSTVQLDHRIMAMTTFTTILTLWAYSRSGRIAAVLPRDAKKGAMGLVHLVTMQAALGISTLIYLVPIPLAAAHQAGSLAVLSGALVLAHRMHVPAPTVRLIQRRLKQLKQ